MRNGQLVPGLLVPRLHLTKDATTSSKLSGCGSEMRAARQLGNKNATEEQLGPLRPLVLQWPSCDNPCRCHDFATLLPRLDGLIGEEVRGLAAVLMGLFLALCAGKAF